MLKQSLLFFFATLFSSVGFAQTELKVSVIDSITKERLIFAEVIVLKAGKRVAEIAVDTNGWAEVNPVDSGIYDIESFYMGYNDAIMYRIVVKPNQVNMIEIKMRGNPDDTVIHVDIVKEVPMQLIQSPPK